MKIAIVRNAGSAIANRVLQGVYGTMTAEEGAAKGTLKFAPEFGRISHLFRMVEGGQVDVEVSGVEVIEVPDAMANDVKALLMHQMGARWQSMYSAISPQGDNVTRALLSAEAAQVAQGVTTHMASMGIRLYKVTASVEAQTAWRSNEYGSEAEMLRGMRPIPGAQFNLLDVEIAGRSAGTAAPAPAEVAQTEETAAVDAQPERQIHFEGHKAAGLVTYEIEIAASSREGAAALAQYVLNDNSLRGTYISQNLTPAPLKLENVRQGDAVSYDDAEEFGDGESYGDRQGY
jgi:hypothetical protein